LETIETIYRCPICHKESTNKGEIEACVARGRPEHKFKNGQPVEIKTLVNKWISGTEEIWKKGWIALCCTSAHSIGNHIPHYGIKFKDGGEGLESEDRLRPGNGQWLFDKSKAT